MARNSVSCAVKKLLFIIIIIVVVIIINEYPKVGLTASISVQHVYYRHELQQELY